MQKRMGLFIAAIAAFFVFHGVSFAPCYSGGNCVVVGTLAVAQEAEAPAEMEGAPTSFWDYWNQGGPTMYPLLLCAVWATAVLIELILKMRVPVFVPPDLTRQFRGALMVADYQKAWRIGSESPSPLSRVFAAGIAKLTKGREAVEESSAEAAAMENSIFTMKNSYVSLMAAIAPLLGLFGTISGMIGAFNAMAYGGAVGDPTKLAGDIGEALITTYAGLLIAIPCMVLFYVMQNRLRKMMTLVQSTMNDLLDLVDFDTLPPDLVIVSQEMKAAARRADAARSGKAASSRQVKAAQSSSVATADTVQCPNCKKDIPVGANVCPNCKAEIDWSE